MMCDSAYSGIQSFVGSHCPRIGNFEPESENKTVDKIYFHCLKLLRCNGPLGPLVPTPRHLWAVAPQALNSSNIIAT